MELDDALEWLGGQPAAALPVPQRIANLGAWQETRYASDKAVPTDITLNAGNVSLWVPRASDGLIDYNFQQATLSAQPPYDPTSGGFLGTEPSVSPTSGDSMLASTAQRDLLHDGSTDYTLFYVVRTPGAAGTTRRLTLTNAFAAATANGFELVRSNTSELACRIGNASGTYYAQVTTASSGAFVDLDCWLAVRLRLGTDLRISYAGATATAPTLGLPNPVPALANSFLQNGWRICERLLYRRSLTDGELADLASYFSPRYGNFPI